LSHNTLDVDKLKRYVIRRNEDDGKKERFDLNVIQIFLKSLVYTKEQIKQLKDDGEKELHTLVSDHYLGNRCIWESVEDFDMITPVKSMLLRNDMQAFKLIYKELTNQVNTVSAYEQLMAILPEIVYLEPAF